MPLPRLRPVEMVPVRLDGRDLIAVRDPEGFAEETVLLSPRLYLVATLLDGRREVVDVQAEYARLTGGDLLLSWDLQRMIQELDRLSLLETEAFQQRRRALEEAFRAAPLRPAYHAGRAYPADPAALRQELERHLREVNREELSGLVPRGIVAPHIDPSRGGWCYAWAYAALAAAPVRTVVLLGVAHSGPPEPFVLTRKAFQTPLGVLPVDEAAAAELEARTGDLTRWETVHRNEHSLEFQVLFLQHALSDRPVRMVPLLVSHLERWAGAGSPRGVDEVERVIQALRGLVSGRDDMAVVAGVDFSHVGPRFGDGEPVGPVLEARTSARDREVLQAVVGGDAEAFWQAVSAEGNPQRIDALSAVYVALRILEPVRGRLLRYGQAPDATGLVSFASLALL